MQPVRRITAVSDQEFGPLEGWQVCDSISVLPNEVSDVLAFERYVEGGWNTMDQNGICLRSVGKLL